MYTFRENRIRILFSSTVFIILFAYASPAQAIYNGVPVYNMNVGAVNSPLGTCTGTLIASRLVLTASHCVYNLKATDIWFNIGGFTLPPTSNEPWTHYTPSYAYQVANYVELGGPVPPSSGQTAINDASRDVALLILSKDVPKDVAIPVPFGSIFPPTTAATAIGYGTTGNWSQDSGIQRAAAYFISSYSSYFFCSGDSGGPVLNSSGSIVATISVGGCGGADPFYFKDYYGLPLVYIDTIRHYISLYGGAPDCDATISPTYGDLTTQFKATLEAYGSGGTCSYALDDKGYLSTGSCGSGAAGSVTTFLFPGSTLGPGQHSLVFKIQNSVGSYMCSTPSFTVYAPVGSPNLTMSSPSTSIPTGGKGTFNVTSFTGTGVPTYAWSLIPSAP